MSRAVVDSINVPSYKITGMKLIELGVAIISYLFLHHFWGRYMLINFSELKKHGFVIAGLEHVWFIFVWAAATTLSAVFVLGQRYTGLTPKPIQTIKGLWLSLNAGVFEEITYRGFVFMSAMVGLAFFNFITFGFTRWFSDHLAVPTANWATFHALQPELLHYGSWIFGAAILSAAAEFRDGHKYLGLFGWINAWFIGMVMFYLVFNYGIVTAIIAHVIYDAIIFTLRALTSKEQGYLGVRI